MKIATIVVTYNRKSLLLECLEHLLSQSIQSDIIVVDNNSNDGTEEELKQYINDGKILYYNTGANLGGAGGFQFGIKIAYSLGYDLMWMMDDDSMPEKEALKELMRVHKKLHGNYGYLSSKVIWKDGSLCKMNIQRRTLRQDITDYSKPVIRCTMATFVSVLLKREVVEKVGLPIKEFFIWCDDAEYTRRISKKYKCYVASRSVVEHKTALNHGSEISADTFERIDRYRYLYRNSIYFYRQEGIKGFFIKSLQLCVHILKVMAKAPDHKSQRVKMILKGTKEGLTFRPKVEYVN